MRMWKHRSVLASLAALALIPVMAVSAQAAPPSNDTPDGATVITDLPTTITQDTTEATTDALDAELNQCGAPATNASVWFVYTAPDAGDSSGFLVSMEGSDYSGGFFATEGDPSFGALVACGPGAVVVSTTPGSTYYVVAFSATPVNGGNLEVTFAPAPPAPEISVDPQGQAFKDGSALLTGTYSCSDALFAGVEGTLTQQVGRFKITGFFFEQLNCDGTTQTWSAIVTSDNGLFRGGKSATMSFVFACGEFTCSDGYTEQSVKLNRGRVR